MKIVSIVLIGLAATASGCFGDDSGPAKDTISVEEFEEAILDFRRCVPGDYCIGVIPDNPCLCQHVVTMDNVEATKQIAECVTCPKNEEFDSCGGGDEKACREDGFCH